MRKNRFIVFIFVLCSMCIYAAATTNETALRMPDDQIIAIAIERGNTIALENRVYHLTRPISLRDKHNYVIQGAGPQTILAARFQADQANLPVLDMTGASGCRLANFRIHVDNDFTPPAAGILLARSTEKSAANHTFENIRITGRYHLANVVNIGSELAYWNNPLFHNTQPGGCNYIAAGWWPDEWRKRLDSSKEPLWAGDQWGDSNRAPCGLHTFIGGNFGVYGNQGTESNIWLLPGSWMLNATGTFFSNKIAKRPIENPRGGLTAVQIGLPDEPHTFPAHGIVFTGVYFETPGAQHTFLVHSDASITLTGVRAMGKKSIYKVQGENLSVSWSISNVIEIVNQNHPK